MNGLAPRGSSWTDALLADPGPKHLGDDDRAVGLLVVLQEGHQRPRAGHRGAVEGVDELGALLAGCLVTDVEAACLEVGAVGRAGHLAVLAVLPPAGHPRLQVVLAVGR